MTCMERSESLAPLPQRLSFPRAGTSIAVGAVWSDGITTLYTQYIHFLQRLAFRTSLPAWGWIILEIGCGVWRWTRPIARVFFFLIIRRPPRSTLFPSPPLSR